jgi:hypothetical protein
MGSRPEARPTGRRTVRSRWIASLRVSSPDFLDGSFEQRCMAETARRLLRE